MSGEPEVLSSHVHVMHRRRFKWRGAAGALVLGPAFVFAVLATPLVSRNSWADVAINVAAWVTFVAGAGFRFWATLYIGGRKNDVAVAEGPYSLCRHPLYLGSLLLALSAGLFLKSVVFATALALLTVLYMQGTVRVEEESLKERLGEPYREYCRRVNRFWPSFRSFRTSPRLTVDVHSLYLECARASRWIWLPLLGEVVGKLRDASWWPRLFSVP